MGTDFAELGLVMHDIWPAFMGLLGLVIWLVRLEGKLSASIERQDSLERKNEILEEIIRQKLSGLEKALARVEGYLQRERSNEPNA